VVRPLTVKIIDEAHPSPVNFDIVALNFGHKEGERGLFDHVLPLKLSGTGEVGTPKPIKAGNQSGGKVIQAQAYFCVRMNEFLQGLQQSFVATVFLQERPIHSGDIGIGSEFQIG